MIKLSHTLYLPIAIFILSLTICVGSCKNDQAPSSTENKVIETKQPDEKDQSVKAKQNSNKGSTVSSKTNVVGHKFWDNIKFFFKDYVGEVSEVVYSHIKGQKYFPETAIFVYATSEDMVGTPEYIRVEGTMASTRLDDRIFIWVHLENNGELKFIKKLISDNIKDKIDQGPLTF